MFLGLVYYFDYWALDQVPTLLPKTGGFVGPCVLWVKILFVSGLLRTGLLAWGVYFWIFNPEEWVWLASTAEKIGFFLLSEGWGLGIDWLGSFWFCPHLSS